MNEQTQKQLEQLALKLGTTTEYLWDVLLKQAPVSSLVDLFILIVLIIIGYILFTLNKKLFVKTTNTQCYNYYDENVGFGVVMIVASFFWCVCFIFSLLKIDLMIAGFLNPEYWALKEVIMSLNGCR